MRLNSVCGRVSRWLCLVLLVTASGGSTFVLSGCDPTVSSLILTGFNDLSNTFVDAFFTLLANQAAEDQGTTTDTTTDTTT